MYRQVTMLRSFAAKALLQVVVLLCKLQTRKSLSLHKIWQPFNAACRSRHSGFIMDDAVLRWFNYKHTIGLKPCLGHDLSVIVSDTSHYMHACSRMIEPAWSYLPVLAFCLTNCFSYLYMYFFCCSLTFFSPAFVRMPNCVLSFPGFTVFGSKERLFEVSSFWS